MKIKSRICILLTMVMVSGMLAGCQKTDRESSNHAESKTHIQDNESTQEGESDRTEEIPEEVLIAPALDAAEVEPSYDLESMESVYVPDLGVATGYRFYTEGKPEGLKIYSVDKSMSKDEVMALLDEYFYLLDSLPYFEVSEAPRLVRSGTGYTGVLIYTGTGRVIQEEDSFYNGIAYAFDFEYDLDDRKIYTQYAKGLKIVDTGHRLTGTDYPTQQVYGPRICDAFYECGGTYYSSDQTLVAQSGECAILLNGEPYYGSTVDSNATRYYVKGYHRSDWIEIFMRENYPMDEDVYTRSDLIQYKTSTLATADIDDFVVFSISDKNGADWIQPRPGRNASFEGISIRVLQWEPKGDVVLYFYADLYLEDEPYEIEGLLVTNPTVNEANRAENDGDVDGSSSVEREQTCSSCSGSGRCGSCGGDGSRIQWMAQEQVDWPCASCFASGNCSSCGGDGKK